MTVLLYFSFRYETAMHFYRNYSEKYSSANKINVSFLFRTPGLYSLTFLNFLNLFQLVFHIHANISVFLTQIIFLCKVIDCSVCI